MKALVVGGAGYIGGVTASLLSDAGHDVCVIDNLSTGHKDYADKYQFFNFDILDKKALDSKIQEIVPDVVLHFGAKIQVEESTRLPAEYFENNVFGSIRLLEAMAKNSIRNFVFSSSAAVYGNPASTKGLAETDDCDPTNPYGLSKLMVEQLLKSYQSTKGMNWIAFRYFNAAGAYRGMAMDYPFTSHLIPSITKSVVNKSDFKIFGKDYPTPDGTCVRDFVHVLDIARAHVVAAEKMVAGSNAFNQAYNLGSGNGYSVLEVINEFEAVTKQKVKSSFERKRPGDPAILIADPQKAKDDLGWTVDFGLKDMISSHWDWYQSKNKAADSL